MFEKLIGKIKQKHYWIVAFVLGAVAMFVMLSYSQMLTSGKYVVLGGDAWEIYIANIRMLIRNLLHGESIWYSFTTSMGYNTALTVAFELMSPFNILFVLFAWADPNVILAIILIAKVGTAAAAFQLFASRALGHKRITSVVFAIFYAMCAFTVEYCIANFMWLDGIYMLPIVAWATYVAVKKNKYLFLTLSYAYIFIVQFYMGYLLAGFSFMLYVLLLAIQKKEERTVNLGNSIGKYILSVIVSVAVSAFLWVPVLTFLLHHTVSDSTQFSSLGVSPFAVFNNLFWGEFQDYHTYPYIYCGLPCLVLAPFYFTNKKISGRERLISGILLAFFLLGCMVLPIYKILHAFDAPDMWNYRFSFIVSFLLCTVALKESEYAKEINLKHLTLFGIGLVLFYCVEQRLQPLEIGWVARNSNNGLLINCAFVLLWILFASLSVKNIGKRLTIVASMLLLTLAEVVTNGCVRTFDANWQQGLTKEEYYYTWEKEATRNLAEADRLNAEVDANEFYRLCIYGDAIHNSDAYFGYNGLSDFNSAENEALREWMRNMGFYTTTRRTGGTGLTPPMEMVLSVKDTMRLYVDMAMLGVNTDLKVYENEYFLPLGYMVNNEALADVQYSGNVFENQNRFLDMVSGVEDVYVSVPKEKITITDNGLIYNDEDQTIYLTNPSGGNVTFQIMGVPGPVYAEVDPAAGEEGVTGLEWGTIMNEAHSLDSKVSVPFAAESIGVGENHMITIESKEGFGGAFPVNALYFYSLDEKKMKEAYESLAEETLKVTQCKNGYIKGKVSVTGDRRVLFTSVPYTDGWKAKLNGTEWEIVPVCNGAFCAVVLPDVGEYELEMTYRCPGASRGLLITAAGIILLLATLFSKKENKAKSTNKEM